MPLGPIVPVSRDDNVATRVIGGGAGIARAYKQGRRAARSVYGLYFERESRPAGAFWAKYSPTHRRVLTTHRGEGLPSPRSPPSALDPSIFGRTF